MTIEPRGVQKSIHAESKSGNEAMVMNNHNLLSYFRSMYIYTYIIYILPSTNTRHCINSGLFLIQMYVYYVISINVDGSK